MVKNGFYQTKTCNIKRTKPYTVSSVLVGAPYWRHLNFKESA